jgi:hypothetical protein
MGTCYGERAGTIAFHMTLPMLCRRYLLVQHLSRLRRCELTTRFAPAMMTKARATPNSYNQIHLNLLPKTLQLAGQSKCPVTSFEGRIALAASGRKSNDKISCL